MLKILLRIFIFVAAFAPIETGARRSEPQSPDLRQIAQPNGMQCSVQRSTPDLELVARPGVVEVSCSAATDQIVRCDGVGWEPIDVSVSTLCRTGKLPAVPARTVRVSADWPSRVSVEWSELGADLNRVVLATRLLEMSGLVDLSVSQSLQRLMTFSVAGFSPVTVTSAELSSGVWKLPATPPGGEVAVVLRPEPFLPRSLQLFAGKTASYEAAFKNGLASIPGLRPGIYQGRLRYDGGVSNSIRSFKVDDQKSNIIGLPVQAVGAVEILADAAACGSTDDLRVRSVEGKAPNTTTIEILRRPHERQCDQRIEGLKPGHYQIALGSGASEFVSRDFDILQQRATLVDIAATEVTVTGRIKLNDRPFSGQLIQFSKGASNAFAAPVATALVGTDGSYVAHLPAEGDYRITLSRGQKLSMGQAKIEHFVRGLNNFDWSAIGGTLSLDLSGWDRTSDVAVTLTQLSGKPAAGTLIQTNLTLGRSDKLPLILPGLALEQFRVKASQRSVDGGFRGKVSETRGFSFTADHSETSLVLNLAENRAELLIEDDARRPVTSAVVTGANVVPNPEPGLFSMAGVSPGARLVVSAPGFVPTRVLAPSSDRMTLGLERGTTIEVELANPSEPFLLGFIRWKSNQCPVAVSTFGPQRASSSPDRGTVMVINQFPSVDQVEFSEGITFASPRVLAIRSGVLRVEARKD